MSAKSDATYEKTMKACEKRGMSVKQCKAFAEQAEKMVKKHEGKRKRK